MEVGFQLYNDMLARGGALAQGRAASPTCCAPLGVTTEINLHAPALLPDDYCGDVHDAPVALQAARQLRRTPTQIDALLEEIVDRFGKLPPQAQTLIDVHRLRVLAQGPTAWSRSTPAPKRDQHHLHAEPADRPDAHHRAGPEEPAHQARRQREAAHRARAARSRRTARRWCATCCAALGHSPKLQRSRHRHDAPRIRARPRRAAASRRRCAWPTSS